MTSFFVPFTPSRAPATRVPAPRVPATRVRPARARTRSAPRIAWCVLAVVLLLELAVLVFPHRLVLDPAQVTVRVKQATGYTMLALMALAMVFGSLRRSSALARRQGLLNDIHHFGGLLILLLLALHMGQQPHGFLLFMFHGTAVALGSGALRAVLGTKLGRGTSTGLLTLHISLSCLVAAGVLLHLYFVYAYTA